MKNKKRINTFKNWLLARDAASRISTKSNYNSFLESTTSNNIDPKVAMSVFDSITGSSEYYKFQSNFADLGIWKMTSPAETQKMRLTFEKKYFGNNFTRFLDLLGIKDPILPDKIDIEIDGNLDQLIKGPERKILDGGLLFLKFTIKPTKDPKEVKEICKYLIENIADSIDLKVKYKNDILRNWIRKYVLEGSKYEGFPKDFENALVEWMKTAPMDERANAYYEVLSNKDKRYSMAIPAIDSLIKEFGIEIPNKGDIDLGSNIIKRFTS
jgi:hypothetical protein